MGGTSAIHLALARLKQSWKALSFPSWPRLVACPCQFPDSGLNPGLPQ